ncbi:MAG: sugar phosphate isomerase/epimerase [Opitutales bacterium]|nr:sugar phosphate isomerase/epimerase [Opitutales bacterium]
MNRRSFFTSSFGTATALPALAREETLQGHDTNLGTTELSWQGGRSYWPICLDTATLDKSIGIEAKLRLAANAGFDCVEPWDWELEKYEKEGGDLGNLRNIIRDLGLYVPSVIGLWNALDISRENFNQRLSEHRNRLRMVSLLGSERVQVIPNMKDKKDFNFEMASWCYRSILNMAIDDYGLDGAGVVFLNFFQPLSTLFGATRVAFGADHEKAQIIPDTFHMFLGESNLQSFHHLQGDFITIFQFSDCPAGVKPHARHDDKIRVLPGDGVLPLVETLRILRKIDYKGPLSLELYNPEYHKRDPKVFLEEAIRKTVSVAQKGSGEPQN